MGNTRITIESPLISRVAAIRWLTEHEFITSDVEAIEIQPEGVVVTCFRRNEQDRIVVQNRQPVRYQVFVPHRESS